MQRPNGSDPEARVLALASEGRWTEAFTVLVSAYEQDIYRFCFLRVSDRDRAEDLLQGVFLKAWRGFRRFAQRVAASPTGASDKPFRAWLYRIARNLSTDLWRKAKPSVNPEEGMNGFASPRTGQDRMVLQGEVLAALSSLGEKARDAVLLRYREEMKYAEMARILGENEARLQQRVLRALRALRAQLESGPR